MTSRLTSSLLLLMLLAPVAAIRAESPQSEPVDSPSPGETYVDPEPEYDRLDGTGQSGKTVNVIEWEGNLEIHAYPQGSLQGLGVKIDRRNREKPVMVIGYRFDTAPEAQLVRRAILSIDLKEPVRAFRDLSAKGYDKIILSNHSFSGRIRPFPLEAPPTRLHPEAPSGPKSPGPKAVPRPGRGPDPSTGSTLPVKAGTPDAPVRPSAKSAPRAAKTPEAPEVDEAGTIQPFFTSPRK